MKSVLIAGKTILEPFNRVIRMSRVALAENRHLTFNYYWRMLSTGISFLTFFLGSICISIITVPILFIIPVRTERKHKIARYVIHLGLSFFCKLMQFFGLLNVKLKGLGSINKSNNYLIVANHPTLIDALVLLVTFPTARCIVKKSLWNKIFPGTILKQAGFFSNEKSHYLVEQCVEHLRAGNSLIVFPEGTRSPANGLNPFQPGVGHVAARSGCEVLLVVIKSDPPTLLKGQRWFEIPSKPVDLTLEICNPFPRFIELKNSFKSRTIAREFTKTLQLFYLERINK